MFSDHVVPFYISLHWLPLYLAQTPCSDLESPSCPSSTLPSLISHHVPVLDIWSSSSAILKISCPLEAMPFPFGFPLHLGPSQTYTMETYFPASHPTLRHAPFKRPLVMWTWSGYGPILISQHILPLYPCLLPTVAYFCRTVDWKLFENGTCYIVPKMHHSRPANPSVVAMNWSFSLLLMIQGLECPPPYYLPHFLHPSPRNMLSLWISYTAFQTPESLKVVRNNI